MKLLPSYLFFISVNNKNGDRMIKIVITGAYSGLANSLIKELVREDFKIYVTVHTEKQLEFIQKRYQKYPNIVALKVDILTKDKEKIYGINPDILICNAALPGGGALLDITIDSLKEVMDTNVFSNFELIQTVARQMIKKGRGKIIVVSSLAGLVPIPFMASYCASKASLIKLVQGFKQELKMINSNVLIKMIEPGFYHTGFNQFMFNQKYQENSYFENEFEFLQKMDNLVYRYLELKSFNSIVKEMKKAVLSIDKKFIYRKPLWQVIPAKIGQIFLD